MVVMLKLLTSPTCPYCPMASEVVRKFVEGEKDVLAMELSVATEEGLREARRFGISGVPAIIVNDRYVMLGVPSLAELRNVVSMFRES
jgi:small redox-active disulfide protein 1